MKMLAPRRAVRALLALMVLLAPLSAWTAAVPAGGGTRAERAIVHTMSRGEQVVLADRQPLLRAVVDRRGALGSHLALAGSRWLGNPGRPALCRAGLRFACSPSA